LCGRLPAPVCTRDSFSYRDQSSSLPSGLREAGSPLSNAIHNLARLIELNLHDKTEGTAMQPVECVLYNNVIDALLL